MILNIVIKQSMKNMKPENNNYSKQNEHHDMKRQLLAKQIEQYKEKLKVYETIEKDIEEINKHLYQNLHSKINQSSSQNGVKIIKESTQFNSSNLIRRNANKKIKVYELQKKLQKIKKDYHQKHGNLTKYVRMKEEIQKQLNEIDQAIQQEKKTSLNLQTLNEQIEVDHEMIDDEIGDMRMQCDKAEKQKELFAFESKRVEDELKKIRNALKKHRNQTQPDEEEHSLDLSLTENVPINNISYTNNPSISELFLYSDRQSKINVKVSEILKHDSYIHEEHSFNQHSEEMYTHQIIEFDKENTKITNLMNQVETFEEQNENLNNYLHQINKNIYSLESTVKHHKITIDLMDRQIKAYEHKINRQNELLLRNSHTSQTLAKRLSFIEGKRGQLRGKIGIKIEEQRLVKLVNNEMNKDILKVKQKIGCLLIYRKMLENSHEKVNTLE